MTDAEMELEAELLSDGWLVEYLDMEPTVDGIMCITENDRGDLCGFARLVPKPIVAMTVVTAVKGLATLAVAYDRYHQDADTHREFALVTVLRAAKEYDTRTKLAA